MTKSTRLSSASYTALTVSVDCPACGESLPDPSGSLFWTPQEITKAIAEQPNRTCDSCEEPFVLRQQSKAQLYLEVVQKESLATCLQCSQPLHTEEPLTFIDNSNPGLGGCHARCVDAYFKQKRAAEELDARAIVAATHGVPLSAVQVVTAEPELSERARARLAADATREVGRTTLDAVQRCPYGNMPREAGAGHWRDWHRGHGCHLDPDVGSKKGTP